MATMTVRGRRIYKNGAPYQIRGWNYANIPIGQTSGRSWALEPTQIPFDMADLQAAGANCVRIYCDGFDTTQYTTALNYCASYGIDVIMFYYVPISTDYSIATGSTNRANVISAVQTMVNNLKGLPAVIGYGIGNEVNYNLGVTPLRDWYSLLEACIQAGKAIDTTRFYTTSNGGTTDILGAGNTLCPSIDVWGATVYRGKTFTTLLHDIIGMTEKPFILTEYGYDAYDATIPGEDQPGQSSRVVALAQEAQSYYPYLSGYLLFEWCDEWWKAGNSSAHDTTGLSAAADDRDGLFQEEWWGTSLALSAGAGQSRTKRTLYQNMSNYLTTLPNPPSQNRLPVV